MNKWYKTNGILHYSSSGWLVVNLPIDLQKYYHHCLYFVNGLITNRPKFGCHITVIAGKYEQVQHHLAWNKYNLRSVEIEYNAAMIEHEGVYWLTCRSAELTRIRNELGLSDTPKWPFHITIANKKNLD